MEALKDTKLPDTTIKEIVSNTLLAKNKFFNPDLLSLTSPKLGDDFKVEQILEEIQKCQRPIEKERIWVLNSENATELIQSFGGWKLAKKGFISAQTSYNSGTNIAPQAINDSFGENREYMDYYRTNGLTEEILSNLPPVFGQISIQEMPNCEDPLINSVEDSKSHSRIMLGDIILIPFIQNGEAMLKAVHFIVGASIKKYLESRKN